eukprot:CCRYP_018890-RA/>CCRYP_018890-RA protein AED:0.36 eAED:0.27 QI:0/0/0/1/0/0/3/0/601
MSTAPLTLTAQHTAALRQLADIFNSSTNATEQTVSTHSHPVTRVPRSSPAPRVEPPIATPSTSTNPTNPDTLRTQRHVHSRRTRNNTPIEEAPLNTGERHDTTPTPKQQRPPRNYITQDDANAIHTTKHNLFTHSTNTPCNITNKALHHVVGQHLQHNWHYMFTPDKLFDNKPVLTFDTQLDHYEKLANDPALQDVWTQAMCKELGRLAQGWNGNNGTDTIFFMTHDEIKRIPRDRTVTYARIVVDYRPQKDDPNRVRITVGGNLINYPGELTTRTADLTTAKILWNSTISTPGARFACADIENMYLQTPMDRYEYMHIKADLIPKAFMDKYKLWDKIYNGHVYMEIRRGCYGLPQAGILANKLLKQRLATDGYFELPHTPGLFKHISRPIQFTLVVDDFGIKYIGKEHLDHLLQTIKKHYDVKLGLQQQIFRHLHARICQQTTDKIQSSRPRKPVHTPWEPYPIKYGNKLQETLPPDESPTLNSKQIRHIQQIVGSFLYYSRATDPTIAHALSELATQQAHATENTLKRCNHFLDYMSTHPDARIRYNASDMILNVHSDASYLSVKAAKSRAAGIFFLGSIPKTIPPSNSTAPLPSSAQY